MDSSANQASRSARRAAAREARDTFPPTGLYAVRDRASGHLLLGSVTKHVLAEGSADVLVSTRLGAEPGSRPLSDAACSGAGRRHPPGVGGTARRGPARWS